MIGHREPGTGHREQVTGNLLPSFPMRRVLSAILLFAIASTAHAWTAASDQRIAGKAAQLAPNDLRILIEKYGNEYQEGLSRAAADEGSDVHLYFVLSRNGKLRERIERETANIVSM